MKVGKIIKVGDSMAVVIPKSHLKLLGWVKGDYLMQAVDEDQLVFRNMRQRVLHPIHTRKAYGDGNTSRT